MYLLASLFPGLSFHSVTRDPKDKTESSFLSTEQTQFPIHTALIAYEQTKDTVLTNKMQADKSYCFTKRVIEGNAVIMHREKIYVPHSLTQRTLAWYDEYLCTLQTHSGEQHSLSALTMIDPATGWFEIKAITDKSAASIMEHFDNEWLARYPRPQSIIFDNGGEFKNLFKAMCDNYGLKSTHTMSYNPQANSVLERVHQVLGKMLCTQRIADTISVEQPWDNFLAAAAWAIRSTYNTTLDATPG